MKKLLIFVLCFAFCLGITACSGKDGVSGEWIWSMEGYADTSTVTFDGRGGVVWTMSSPTSGDASVTGTYHYDEEAKTVTVVLPEYGTKTYEIRTLSDGSQAMDFMELVHRRQTDN